MSHIHTEPGEHDLTVDAFIVRLGKNQSPKTLLHKHKKLKKLMQIDEHVESNENPWQAVIREESEYDTNQLKVLKSAPNVKQSGSSNAVFLPSPISISSHRYGNENHFHDSLSFAFLAAESPSNEPAEGETRDFVWTDLARLHSLTDNEIIKNSQEIAEFVLEKFNNWRAEEIGVL